MERITDQTRKDALLSHLHLAEEGDCLLLEAFSGTLKAEDRQIVQRFYEVIEKQWDEYEKAYLVFKDLKQRVFLQIEEKAINLLFNTPNIDGIVTFIDEANKEIDNASSEFARSKRGCPENILQYLLLIYSVQKINYQFFLRKVVADAKANIEREVKFARVYKINPPPYFGDLSKLEILLEEPTPFALLVQEDVAEEEKEEYLKHIVERVNRFTEYLATSKHSQ